MANLDPSPRNQRRLRGSAPWVVAGLALFVAATGAGVGVTAVITGSDIKDGSITGADIRDGSITTGDLARGAVTKNRMAPGARLALRKSGQPGPAGAQGPAGTAGAAGAQGERGPGGSGGSGGSGGFVETFTQAGPITAPSSSSVPFSLDRPVAWTTPPGAIDTVFVTAQLTAGTCVYQYPYELRVFVRATVDDTRLPGFEETVLWPKPDGTSSLAAEMVVLGPGAHSITGFSFQTSGCAVTVDDVMVAVSRTG